MVGEPGRGTAPEPAGRSTDRGAIAFFHAHPDDEAIFTGGTMARLARAGWRVVLVVATQGELGLPVPPGADEEGLADRRVAETRAAAALLGVHRVEFLGYHDSGMRGDPANQAATAFCRAPVEEAAARLAAVLEAEQVGALVTYDGWGIYGHPDHVKVYEVGNAAASLVHTPCLYEVTVDREYLHFVETHLVAEAGVPHGLGLAASGIGVATVEVDLVVDVRPVLEVKRAAMSAHASQIPETASALRLPGDSFAAVYGFEWFVRRRGRGPIESLL